jgi:small-conductance mechanosensitive channel
MMLTKLTELLSQTRTLQLLAFIIIILVILLSAKEWLSNASLLRNNVNSFSLRDWTVELAAHLNWLDNESDNLANSLTLFAFLALATSIGLPRQIAAFVAGINLGAFFWCNNSNTRNHFRLFNDV